MGYVVDRSGRTLGRAVCWLRRERGGADQEQATKQDGQYENKACGDQHFSEPWFLSQSRQENEFQGRARR